MCVNLSVIRYQINTNEKEHVSDKGSISVKTKKQKNHDNSK